MTDYNSIWLIPGLVERMLELVEDGNSRGKTAEILSHEFDVRITRNSCIAKCNRLGIGDKRTPEQKAQAYRSRESDKKQGIKRRATPSNTSNTDATHRATATRRFGVAGNSGNSATVPGVEPRNISLLQLEARDCRWPYGNGPFTFCGNETVPGQSYCPGHLRLAARDDIIAERALRRGATTRIERREKETA